MRLHFVCHSLPPVDVPLASVGGMQRVGLEWLAALEAEPGLDLVAHVVRAPWSAVRVAAARFFVGLGARLLTHCRPGDVVVFSSVTSACAALPALGLLRARGIRTACMAHGLDVTFANAGYQLAVRRTLPAVDVVLPVSRSTASLCHARGAREVKVLPNGMDAARFDGLTRTEAVRPGLHVLGVGRLVPRKGFTWFVETVLPRVPDDVTFELVGDGPEREGVERAVERAGLESRVRVRGRVEEPELLAAYARADLLVMPNVPVASDVEGFGLVILEAALASVPALASRMEGMTDVVVEGETGWFAEPLDPSSFAERLLEIRSNGPERIRRGAAARLRARTQHGWSSLVDELLGFVATPAPRALTHADVHAP